MGHISFFVSFFISLRFVQSERVCGILIYVIFKIIFIAQFEQICPIGYLIGFQPCQSVCSN